MNSNNIRLTVSVSGLFLSFLIFGVYADTGSLEANLSLNNSPMKESPTTSPYALNQTGNYSSAGNTTGSISGSSETPVIYSGIEHPNEESEVKSSTPDGNPLIPKYALGGVSVDIMGHIMEARGNENNVSSEITFHDHTDANGYITTLIKEFHYISGVDTDSG